MTPLLIGLFVALLVLGVAVYRGEGYVGFAPAAIILVVLVIMLLTGNFNLTF